MLRGYIFAQERENPTGGTAGTFDCLWQNPIRRTVPI